MTDEQSPLQSHADLDALSRKLFDLLVGHHLRIVFAESCTGGLISASMTRYSGVSDVMCGSAVVYRTPTKGAWLGISDDLLADPGPVSEVVAREMADRVLLKTPEARISTAITGHLGPQAPDDQDGLVFIATGQRQPDSTPRVTCRQFVLSNDISQTTDDAAANLRGRRQITAACLAISETIFLINSLPDE